MDGEKKFGAHSELVGWKKRILRAFRIVRMERKSFEGIQNW